MNNEIVGYFSRTSPEVLTLKEYIDHEKAMSTIALRERTVGFLFKAYGWTLGSTIALILLQGFGFLGFKLPIEFLKWLGGATIVELVGLLAMVIGSLFSRKNNE